MNFRSDNVLGCPPAILEAIARVNDTPTHPYGNDPVTARLGPLFSDLFEHETFVFPVSTGTAANGLSLAAITPPWGGVYCHTHAHIARDEWCGPEFYTGGARLLTMEGAGAKFAATTLADRIGSTWHAAHPSALSITQVTEAGTVYSLDELHALTDVARHASLQVQMDGARFANALVALGCSPADLSWRAGIDTLAFGATKNGTLTAEAVVVFRKDLAEQVMHRRKRAGQVSSKMRFLSAQLEAYVAGGLWLQNARTANTRARQLATALAAMPHLAVVQAVDANLVFVRIAAPHRAALRASGFAFLDWPLFGDDVIRLICGFSTTAAQVDALVAALEALGALG